MLTVLAMTGLTEWSDLHRRFAGLARTLLICTTLILAATWLIGGPMIGSSGTAVSENHGAIHGLANIGAQSLESRHEARSAPARHDHCPDRDTTDCSLAMCASDACDGAALGGLQPSLSDASKWTPRADPGRPATIDPLRYGIDPPPRFPS